MTDGFEVWGTYIMDRCPKRISAHKTIEAAEAEMERVRKLRVHFWDGTRPLYSDLSMKASTDAIMHAMANAMQNRP